MSFLIQISLSSVRPSIHVVSSKLPTYYLPTYLPTSLPTYYTRSCLPACLPASFLRFENFISFLILSSFSHPWGGLIHSRHLLNIRGPIHHPRSQSEVPIQDPIHHPRSQSEVPIQDSIHHPRSHPRFLSKIPSTIREPIRGPHIFEVTSEAPSSGLLPRFHSSEVPSTVSFFKGSQSLIQI